MDKVDFFNGCSILTVFPYKKQVIQSKGRSYINDHNMVFEANRIF